MENWCYDRNTLYSFAKHYETGEALPEDVFRKSVGVAELSRGQGMMDPAFLPSPQYLPIISYPQAQGCQDIPVCDNDAPPDPLLHR